MLVEAFDDEFTTDGFKHFPKHLPRSGNPTYFQDMSVWAGDSEGAQHVRLRLPGMAGTTAQLRFEFTQDGIGHLPGRGRRTGLRCVRRQHRHQEREGDRGAAATLIAG